MMMLCLCECSYTPSKAEIKCGFQTFPGDSGSGIVMKDGKLLAMHVSLHALLLRSEQMV